MTEEKTKNLSPEQFAAIMRSKLAAKFNLGDRLVVLGQRVGQGAEFEVFLDGKNFTDPELIAAIDEFFVNPDLTPDA